MLIYNTTYHVEESDAHNFLIWLTERYIPAVLSSGMLRSPKLSDVLSHNEPGSKTYTLQWEVDDSRTLHQWHTKQGCGLNEELLRAFKNKVVGFPTLLESIELPQYD